MHDRRRPLACPSFRQIHSSASLLIMLSGFFSVNNTGSALQRNPVKNFNPPGNPFVVVAKCLVYQVNASFDCVRTLFCHRWRGYPHVVNRDLTDVFVVVYDRHFHLTADVMFLDSTRHLYRICAVLRHSRATITSWVSRCSAIHKFTLGFEVDPKSIARQHVISLSRQFADKVLIVTQIQETPCPSA